MGHDRNESSDEPAGLLSYDSSATVGRLLYSDRWLAKGRSLTLLAGTAHPNTSLASILPALTSACSIRWQLHRRDHRLIMKGARIWLSVGFIAAIVLIGTRPAAGAAISIMPAFQYEKADAGLVQRVHRKWGKRTHTLYRYGPYGCYAGYLPFGYRPHMYYGCPGYGWPYWRPPEQELVPRSGALNYDFRENSPRQPGGQPVTLSRET